MADFRALMARATKYALPAVGATIDRPLPTNSKGSLPEGAGIAARR
ncbi:MAG: hypothetical protein IJO39_11880 [Clostridia bacterium]|nr:hypothetical protein [Clostridia bacterium]